MKKKASSRRRTGSGGFTLVELLIVVAVLGILAAMAEPGLHAAMYKARRNSLIASGKTLFVAFTAYNVDMTAYPPQSTPVAEALDTQTLHPLTTHGYLTRGSITKRLRNNRLTSYDSPDNPTTNNDFYAVMTDKRDITLQVLVADTDEYPGHMGTNYHGVYIIQGATITPVGDL